MRAGLLVALAALGVALAAQPHDILFARRAQAPAKVDFARDVQPILREHCVECHGPSQQMRGLRLDRRRDAMPNRVGANGARIIPGKSLTSPVYQRLLGNAGAQMPPGAPLPEGQIAVIKAWIDQGAEWPDALSGDTVTAKPDPAVIKMAAAIRNGNREELTRALRTSPTSVNGRGENGWTPIMYAALYGDADAVRLLLAQGANPNVQNDAGGTALMYAVEDAGKIRLLLESGADANARSGEGRTALMIAVGRNGSNAVVKLLLDSGANPSAQMPDGRGPLALAAAARDASLLNLLLERGAGKTPLPLANALLGGCGDCFDMLLTLAGPTDLNAALNAAVRAGDIRVTNMLLERGAQPGPNILQFAALSPKALPPDVIQMLIDRGANIHSSSRRGKAMRRWQTH
jgi:ankyrin repeat protein